MKAQLSTEEKMQSWSAWEDALFFVTDLEAEGADPEKHSMIALATVAVDVNKNVYGKFRVAIKQRQGTTMEKRCWDEFWSKNEEMYNRLTDKKIQQDPQVAIHGYAAFLTSVFRRSKKEVAFLASDCLPFESKFVSYYLDMYAKDSWQSPLQNWGLDAYSLIAGIHRSERYEAWRYVEKEGVFVDQGKKITHDPLDDAWSQAGWIVDHIRASFSMPQVKFDPQHFLDEKDVNLLMVNPDFGYENSDEEEMTDSQGGDDDN